LSTVKIFVKTVNSPPNNTGQTLKQKKLNTQTAIKLVCREGREPACYCLLPLMLLQLHTIC